MLFAIAALATALILSNRQPNTFPRPLTRFAITLPPGETAPLVTWPALALSPDGMQLVYVAGRGESKRLYLRSMDRLEVTPLGGTENASSPFFSPDSQWIGFFADGKLKKINLRGGFPTTHCDTTPDDRGGAWGSDDTIIFAPGPTTGLMRVAASGGTPQVLTSPDLGKRERTHRWPEILSGSKAVVFTIGSVDSIDYYLDAKIAVQSLETGKREILPVEGTFARYDPAGYLVLAQRGGLFAVPFDLKRLQVTGPPVRVLDDVAMDASTGAIDFSLSKTGSLSYLPGGWSYADLVLAWVDRKGSVLPLPAPARAYANAHLSPDGKRVAVSDQGSGSSGTFTRWQAGRRQRPGKRQFGDVPLWIKHGWEWALSRALGLPCNEPDWFRVPVMRRIAISTPNVMAALRRLDRDQARPYNFALSPVLVNLSGEQITLLGPFEKDPARWRQMWYVNVHDGSRHTLELPNRLVMAQTFDMVFAQYVRHPESKSLAPDGTHCKGDTCGLLRRYPVKASGFHLISKETERGWQHSDDVSTLLPSLVRYQDRSVAGERLRQRLLRIPLDVLERVTGLSRHTIVRTRAGKRVHPRTLELLARRYRSS